MVTSALLAYRQKYLAHQRWAIYKPLQSGTGDGEHYQRSFELTQPLETVNPLRFKEPLAPPIAALQEGKTINLGLAWQTLQMLQQSHEQVLVEGVGGLGSPLTQELTVADLARDWRLPTLLVIPVRLGAIGQAVANVALARQAGLTLRGIVLNCVESRTADQVANWAPVDLLQSLTQVPILGMLPYLEDWSNLDRLAAAATQLNLELLLSKTSMPTAIAGV
ncbi:MAG: dethiobiotin synthase [Cyanobacteria bacterium P01_A01_bin.17]